MESKITPTNVLDDQGLDQTLRPKSFSEYVGQENIKENLRIILGAAKKRSETTEHLLLHGPSGLGKTTLAYLIAKELGSSIKITSGTALEKAGDVGSILTGLNDGDVLFIDEVHRLNKMVEEVIYPAMENFKLDIIIGKGNSAKTLQIDLPKFTLIAATTKISMLSSPFRSRFGVNFRLDFYKQEDIEKIITRSAKLLNIQIDKGAVTTVAQASRYTPRIANRLLKRVRDYAQMQNQEVVTADLACKALQMLEIDNYGLEETDRKILRTIGETFNGGPVGLKSVAAAISEEENTIEDVYEPYLIQIGFLARTPKGRVTTRKGLEHVGIKKPLLDF
ncbi:MAG: Holliday junction DNA helicase RuvB [Candidatus Yanofskybacteria bacterium RIFCSPHIGHO2_02_FULL_39_10]|uniref:Holliday junction branch migration complex subunit RuvB n=1 Tax=Candidatus Yanofskybacteria bacterium RIFCSPHIGHO2_02_FULL_39_10 TaxID=1802674 RepID=A0A1F8F4C4_9BACT|nr:MAG: Holliday junction DNA helicase RuvB [Candidatus Yanofskybacteria bacterium RIFCSPHIGHO2_02_FULL_39_10]